MTDDLRILVTGDRKWTDMGLIRRVLSTASSGSTVIHGGALGADRLSGAVAAELGLAIECYKADWAQYGRAAGPIRNILMLDQEPDVVVYFHENLENSKGTRHCVEIARKRGFLVVDALWWYT